jgi:hypothetical protein
MRSMTRRGGRAALAFAVVSLVVAGAAFAAGGRYKGGTSQHQPVSFRIYLGAVRDFKIVIHDTCPDGHILIGNETFPTMNVAHNEFGGSFAPVAAVPGEHATLHGTVRAREVTGSISDTSFSHRERKLCDGSATFTAHPA